jgi:hypothetical protein
LHSKKTPEVFAGEGVSQIGWKGEDKKPMYVLLLQQTAILRKQWRKVNSDLTSITVLM